MADFISNWRRVFGNKADEIVNAVNKEVDKVSEKIPTEERFDTFPDGIYGKDNNYTYKTYTPGPAVEDNYPEGGIIDWRGNEVMGFKPGNSKQLVWWEDEDGTILGRGYLYVPYGGHMAVGNRAFTTPKQYNVEASWFEPFGENGEGGQRVTPEEADAYFKRIRDRGGRVHIDTKIYNEYEKFNRDNWPDYIATKNDVEKSTRWHKADAWDRSQKEWLDTEKAKWWEKYNENKKKNGRGR